MSEKGRSEAAIATRPKVAVTVTSPVIVTVHGLP